MNVIFTRLCDNSSFYIISALTTRHTNNYIDTIKTKFFMHREIKKILQKFNKIILEYYTSKVNYS